MFGKKKAVVNTQTKDFHCATCGLDCADRVSLDRHMGWAHSGSKKQEPAGEKKT
jgi:hypothetical protein